MKIQILQTVAELRKHLPADSTMPVYWDTETIGLYGQIRLSQYYVPDLDPDTVYILDTYTNKIPNYELAILHRPLYMVGWNLAYDFGTTEDTPSEQFLDLYLVAKASIPSEKYTLDAICELLGIDAHKEAGLVKKEMQKSNWKASYLSQDQYTYAALDVWVLPKLRGALRNRELNVELFELDHDILRMTLQMQSIGMDIDHSTVDALLHEYSKEEGNLQTKLPRSLNVNSPVQVRKFIGLPKADKPTLSIAAYEGNENARAILDLRQCKKTINFLEGYAGHDRLKGKFSPAGASTGRFSCGSSDDEEDDSFNIQQIPRRVKSIIRVPEEEYTLIGADYSAIELYIGCCVYNEPRMARLFKDKIDPHKDTYHKLSGVPMDQITKEQRNIAKAVNFGFIYGMGAEKFRIYALSTFGVAVTVEEALLYKKQYRATYPAIADYHDRVAKELRMKGYTMPTTALGRTIKTNQYSKAINHVDQGSGSDLIKLAMRILWEKYLKQSNTCRFYNIVHDAIILKGLVEESEEWAKRLEECMIEAWYRLVESPIFHIKDIVAVAEPSIAKIYTEV